MDIILLRHGIAEDDGPDGSDASRRLTDKGIERTGDVARRLASFTDAPDVILTSPKVRAAQTADIVAAVFNVKVQALDELAGGSPSAIAAALLQIEAACVLAVGHEPALSATAEVLTFGDVYSVIELKKAGAICVRAAAGEGGYLRWIVTPKVLGAAGRA